MVVEYLRKTWKASVSQALWLDKNGFELLRDFENLCRKNFLIVSSFQDIADSKIDKWGQRKQLLALLAIVFIGIPAYVLECSLYLIPKESWTPYQFIPDVNGGLGVVGELMSHIFLAMMICLVCDKTTLIKAEASNALEFLTDLRNLVEGQRFFGLNQDEATQLVAKLRKKIIFLRHSARITIVNSCGSQVTGLILFLYKYRQPLVQALLGISFSVLSWTMFSLTFNHMFMIYLSFLIMTDCLIARIKAVILKLDDREGEVHDYRRMQGILDEIESILQTVHLYNRTLRPLLRNMIFFFRTGLCGLFVILSLDLDPFVRLLVLVPVSSVSLNLIMTGLYVSRAKSHLNVLYLSLNSRFVRSFAASKMPIKIRMQAKLLLKELGSDDKDGHFVLGFADGKGPEISSMEITELILETVFNSMMFLSMMF